MSSANPRRLCWVPDLPEEYVGDFSAQSTTIEAILMRRVINSSTQVHVLRGMGGTGKTTTITAVGDREEVKNRFSDAIWFIPLTQNATAFTLLDHIIHVIREVAGDIRATEVENRAKLQHGGDSAMAKAVEILQEYRVLLILDDVWVDAVPQVDLLAPLGTAPHALGQATVFSLVRTCVRRVLKKKSLLNIIISTRNDAVADLVPSEACLSSEGLHWCGPVAKRIIFVYAGVNDKEISQVEAQQSFHRVLHHCGGVQLLLAIVGSDIGGMVRHHGIAKGDVWNRYSLSLNHHSLLAHNPKVKHPGALAMVQSSLKAVVRQLDHVGKKVQDDIQELLTSLCVIPSQQTLPILVLSCLWDVDEEDAWDIVKALAQHNLVSINDNAISVYDLLIDYCAFRSCDVVDKQGLHRVILSGLAKRLLESASSSGSFATFHDWWLLVKRSREDSVQRYVVENVVRHLVEGNLTSSVISLLSDYRWASERLKSSGNRNDLSGFVRDIQTVAAGGGMAIPEHVKKGLGLIADAARLAKPFVAANPRELAFQFYGRLQTAAEQSLVVKRFLSSLKFYAELPWVKADRGVLTPAGGAVILSVGVSESSRALRCVEMLPNGEDVVIGGQSGYLVIFSMKYASVLHELHGHTGLVRCVAVSCLKNRIFSAGRDRTIRAWDIRSGEEVTSPLPLVDHSCTVRSLALTADSTHGVFGDDEGSLTVFNVESGTKRTWPAHDGVINSIALRRGDNMIVSCSEDGTVRRWEFATGSAVGDDLILSGEQVHNVSFNREGNYIAFAARSQVGVLDADFGKIEWSRSTKDKAYCSCFGEDDREVYIGRSNGTTAVLTPAGEFSADIKAHTVAVSDFAISRNGQLLVSVAENGMLSVQRLDRTRSSDSEHTGSKEELALHAFAVFADRKRILCSWRGGPVGLRLVDFRQKSTQEALMGGLNFKEVSEPVGSVVTGVCAIAISPQGSLAVSGTVDGQLLVYNTSNWQLQYPCLCRLPGAIWSVAISNDGAFVAGGSRKGTVALFRLETGEEIQLPLSHKVGEVMNVAFNESCTCLLAVSKVQETKKGKFHFWRNIDRAANVVLDTEPFGVVAGRDRPATISMGIIATETHVATRFLADTRTWIYEIPTRRRSRIRPESADSSGISQLLFEEQKALKKEGSLFIEPFGHTIGFVDSSGTRILGTLETRVSPSFRSDLWAFHDHTGMLVAGSQLARLTSAFLVNGDGTAQERNQLLSVQSILGAVYRANGLPSYSKPDRYNVFISHAGVDKSDIAMPLSDQLGLKDLSNFLDIAELRPGNDAPEEMTRAMKGADIGVFILSPEFAARRWPVRELRCFLERREEAKRTGSRVPTLIPVFYRLTIPECRNKELYKRKKNGVSLFEEEGFFEPDRQKEAPTQVVMSFMSKVTSFTGITNSENALNENACVQHRRENRMRRMRLIDKIVDAVLEARRAQLEAELAGEDEATDTTNGMEREVAVHVQDEAGPSIAAAGNNVRETAGEDGVTGAREQAESARMERSKADTQHCGCCVVS